MAHNHYDQSAEYSASQEQRQLIVDRRGDRLAAEHNMLNALYVSFGEKVRSLPKSTQPADQVAVEKPIATDTEPVDNITPAIAAESQSAESFDLQQIRAMVEAAHDQKAA